MDSSMSTNATNSGQLISNGKDGPRTKKKRKEIATTINGQIPG
jgi:hypothetical protein